MALRSRILRWWSGIILVVFPWSNLIRKRKACSTAASSATAAGPLEPLDIGPLSVTLTTRNESSSLRWGDQLFHLLMRTYMNALQLLTPLLCV